jgi:hypothetical protein
VVAQDQLFVARSELAEIVTAVLVGVAAGAVTSLLQGQLRPLDPFASSAGSWSAIAALLAARTRRPGFAVLVGVLVLWSLMGGYLLATELRDLSMSSTFVPFWLVCGALGGPFMGLAGSWLRHDTAWRAALAVAALARLLLGEAVYGLTVLAATTGATYWVLQTAVSLALLVGWAVRRRPDTRWLALAVAGTAAGAGSFALVWVSPSVSTSV